MNVEERALSTKLLKDSFLPSYYELPNLFVSVQYFESNQVRFSSPTAACFGISEEPRWTFDFILWYLFGRMASPYLLTRL